MSPEWIQLQDLVTAHRGVETFSPEFVTTFPDAVKRYFTTAIEPGTPLAQGVRLAMRGGMKIGRWLPFRARQLLVPRLGTVWEARVAGVISGSDRYVAGTGGMDWKLLSLLRLVHAQGDDVTRSAAERAAGESIWVPTALVRDAAWSQPAGDRIAVEVETDGNTVVIEHDVDAAGRVRSSCFQRWGDPDNTGTWGLHPFGVEVSSSRTFGGVTIPDRGRAGWRYGTDRWDDGVFFRYEITSYELLA
jgi:hypothetical protein